MNICRPDLFPREPSKNYLPSLLLLNQSLTDGYSIISINAIATSVNIEHIIVFKLKLSDWTKGFLCQDEEETSRPGQ